MNNANRMSVLSLFSCLITSVGISALLISPALAQVNGAGPSPASAFDIVLNLPGDEAIITGASGESIGGGFSSQTIQLNISDGGTLGPSFEANRNTEVNISGGTVGGSFEAKVDSEVNISGGTVGPHFNATAFADVTLTGGEFRLDGADFSGSRIGAPGVFTGTLADGSTFIFGGVGSLDRISSVNLEAVPLPAVDLSPIVVNSPVVNGPSGLRAGQTLTVEAGGSLRDNFAVIDATLNVDDGNVGDGTEVFGGLVNISGGSVGENFEALSGSEINISGGTVGRRFEASPGSMVTLSGGTIGSGFSNNASDVELVGGEFRFNGVDFLDSTVSISIFRADGVFTGTLADGSTFILSGIDRARDRLTDVTLTAAALPSADLTPIVVNSPVVNGPSGLRAGQTLTVEAGGSLRGNFAVIDATLNVDDGIVGIGAEVSNSVVNISGGNVGDDFQAFFRSEINISGGSVGDEFSANSSEISISGGSVGDDFFANSSEISIGGGSVGDEFSANSSEINISGGTIGDSFNASNSVVNITGGAFGDDFSAEFRSTVNISNATSAVFFGDRFSAAARSEVNISGGVFGYRFSAATDSEVNISGGIFGDGFEASSDSEVNFFGSEFFIDGVELDALQLGRSYFIDDREVTLSGLLANGDPFSIDLTAVEQSDEFVPEASFTVTLTSAVPEPSFSTFITLAVAMGFARRRRN